MKFSTNNLQFSKKEISGQGGFTLVELLVAMGIFVSVLGIIIGIFIGALRAERSLVGFMAINDNVSLALEQMAREIRTGEDFSTPEQSVLIFTNAQNEQVAYRAPSGIIERGTCPIITCANLAEFADFTVLTGNKAIVSRLSFELVNEAFPSSQWPPRVTIRLGVESSSPDTFGGRADIQTTVSARGN